MVLKQAKSLKRNLDTAMNASQESARKYDQINFSRIDFLQGTEQVHQLLA